MKGMNVQKSFALFALSAVMATSAVAQSSPEAAIRREYTELAALTRKKDVKGLQATWNRVGHKDFKMVARGGQTLDGKMLISQMTSQMGFIDRFTKTDIKLTSIRVSGNTATVEATNDYEFTMKNPQDGKPIRIRTQGRSRDTWTRVGNRWQIREIRQLSERTWMNGKEMKMPTGNQ
jgi:ketosteroid isomerase-like protein